MPKLDWKSDEVRDAVRPLVLVCLAFVVMYSVAMVGSFLPVVI